MRELAVVWFLVMVTTYGYGLHALLTYESEVGEPMAMCTDYWRLAPEQHPWCAEVLGITAPTEEPTRGPAVGGVRR